MNGHQSNGSVALPPPPRQRNTATARVVAQGPAPYVEDESGTSAQPPLEQSNPPSNQREQAEPRNPGLTSSAASGQGLNGDSYHRLTQRIDDLLATGARHGSLHGLEEDRSTFSTRHASSYRTPHPSRRTDQSEPAGAARQPPPRANPAFDLPPNLPAAAESRILQSYIRLLSESRENEKRARQSSEGAFQAALAAKELEIELLGEVGRLKDEFRDGKMAKMHDMLNEVYKVTVASDSKVTELHDILSDIQVMTTAALRQRRAREAQTTVESEWIMSLADEFKTLPHKIGTELHPKLDGLKGSLDRLRQSLQRSGERQQTGSVSGLDELNAAIKRVNELSGGEYVVVRAKSRKTGASSHPHGESAPLKNPDHDLMDIDCESKPEIAQTDNLNLLSGDDHSSILDADIDCADIVKPLHPSSSPFAADIISDLDEKNIATMANPPSAVASGKEDVAKDAHAQPPVRLGPAVNAAPVAPMYLREMAGHAHQSGAASVEEELGVYPGWPGPPLTCQTTRAAHPSPQMASTSSNNRRATPPTRLPPSSAGADMLAQLNQDYPVEATCIWYTNADRQAALRDHFAGTGLRPLGCDALAGVFKYGIQYKPEFLTPAAVALNASAFGSAHGSRTLIVSNIAPQTALSQVLPHIHGGPVISAILAETPRQTRQTTATQTAILRFATNQAAQTALSSLPGETGWTAALSEAPTFPENEATLAALRTGRTRCLLLSSFPRDLLPTLFRDLHLDFTLQPHRAGVLEEAWYKPTTTGAEGDQEEGNLFLFYASLAEAVAAYSCLVARRAYADVRKGVRFLEDPCAVEGGDSSGGGPALAEVHTLGSLRDMSLRGMLWQFANKTVLSGGSPPRAAPVASEEQPAKRVKPRPVQIEDEIETARGVTVKEEDEDIEMLARGIKLASDDGFSSPATQTGALDEVADPVVEHDMPWTAGEIERFRLRLQCPACRDGPECPLRNQPHYNVLPTDMTSEEMDMLCYPAVIGESGKMIWELARGALSPTSK